MTWWHGKPIAWLQESVSTPPFSKEARVEAGFLLRQLPQGQRLGLPQCRPMPVLGARCHELRVQDVDATWRVLVRLDPDAIVVAGILRKKTRRTPAAWLEACRRRLATYDWDREKET
ncbi:MAG: type II toxin-antitoxin system RelE/ParE family toxin [Acidobacteria bacterium]|nr:type II toxin-antitoxin system RelE/ParE family toxin [Acidobacteriota bacterium]